MDAGDDDVHLRKNVAGEVERAVRENVDLDSGEDFDAVDLLGGLANALYVSFGALVVESVGEGEILRVVGDGHVLVAALAGRGSHLFDGAFSVGLDGVG